MKPLTRLLAAFSVATLLGAPTAFSQEEPPAAEPAPTQVSTMDTSGAYTRALRHYRNGNFTAALQELGQVEQAEPERADVLFLIGYSHYKLKHFDDSLDAFRRSFQADPNFDPRGIYQARYRPEGS